MKNIKRIFVIATILVFSIFPDTLNIDGQETKSQVKGNSEIFGNVNLKNYPQDYVTITGIVVDNEGNPLPGVNLIIAGETMGAITDIEGRFKLAVSPGSEVNISFTGFNTTTFTVQEFTNIQIDIESGIIKFCCTNHDPSHCAKTMNEMRILTEEYKCTFK